MSDFDKELDWVLSKHWEDDDPILIAYDGIQYLGYRQPPNSDSDDSDDEESAAA